MALKHGFNITESDWKKYLEQNERQQNGIRTWRQLFGNASLGYNAQSDALRTDYASAIAEAYKSNFAQRNAILGAGLSKGSTQQLLSQNQADLHAAYDTYIRNYGSAASTLAESYGEEVGAINEALTERAANFANLYNSAYKYLSEELYGSTFTDINKNTFDYMTANNLGYALNDTTLKSWDELSRLLVDGDGNLTTQGVEFFDQMFNAEPQGYTRTDKDGNEISVRTFDQWLSDTNPELRDWWVGQDVFNYTRAGTNVGSTKVGVGLESDDQKYHQGEYVSSDDINQSLSSNSYVSEINAYLSNASRYDAEAKRQGEIVAQNTTTNKSSNPRSKNTTTSTNRKGQAAKGAQTSYRSLAAQEREKANKTWQNFVTSGAGRTEIDNYYKELLSVDQFNDFLNQNKSLDEEFDKLLEKAKSSDYNEELMMSLNAWFEKYNSALKTYVSNKTRKTSGF